MSRYLTDEEVFAVVDQTRADFDKMLIGTLARRRVSLDNQDFAHVSRAMGIAVTRQSLLTTWKKLQEPWGDLPGLRADEAAEALGSDLATLLNWQVAYNDNGLEGLS